MDKIRRYTSEDYEQMSEWYQDRDLPSPKPSHLPNIGYICDNIAAGFIYLTDSTVCILDSFITNKNASEEKRDRALNLITMHLIEFAKSGRFDLLICSTSSRSIALRAKKFGFQKVRDESCYAREI